MKRFWRGLLATGVIVTVVFASTATMYAAVDMFIKIGDFVGESTAHQHEGDIDVLAWSWGQSNGSAQIGRGMLPKTCIQDLSFTKYIDSSSPEIIMAGLTGDIIPTAVLVVRKAGAKTSLEYIRMTMKNVIISSYTTGGSGGEDRLTENVTLHFESMQGAYQKQKPDGTADGPPITWDVSAKNSGGCQ
jgi:type VI secretion system secreted protein Hcp